MIYILKSECGGQLIFIKTWGVDNAKIDMYVYGEADFSSNLAMQEPLKKLYQYENQPDMKKKLKNILVTLKQKWIDVNNVLLIMMKKIQIIC